MIYILISVIGLYIISAGMLEVDLFLGLVFPLANKNIYFIFGLFIILVFLVSIKTNFKYFRLPVEFIVIFSSYFLFIILEVFASIGDETAKEMGLVIINVFISTITVIIVYNYCYYFMHKRGDPLKYFLKPYFYLSLYIASAGILAWILIIFLFVDPMEWLLPENLMKHDVASLKSGGFHTYTMPYWLGLVRFGQLGGIDIQDLLGINILIPRASGLAREPHMMALYITPALFLIPIIFDSRKNRSFIKFSKLILIIFLLLVFSGTNIIILSSFVIFYLVRSQFILNRHISKKSKILIPLIIITILYLVIIKSNIPFRLDSAIAISNSYLFGNIDNITMFGKPYYTQESRGLFSLIAQLLHLSIFAFLTFKNFFSRNDNFIIFLAPIYVLMHSMKIYSHIGFDSIYLFNMFILVMILDRFKEENKRYYMLNNTNPV